MIKSKLIIVLSLLFVLSLDGEALAGKINSSPALSPDGVSRQQQHRRRRARRKQRSRKAGSYAIKVTPEQTATPAPEPMTGGAPPPSPAAEEMPAKAAPPPPQASPEMDAPGQGAPKKGAPKIKPPTVQIKPPTK